MSDAKWKEATRQILTALDIPAEYVRMGCKISAKNSSASGWLPVHAIGRDDNNPSARIHVGDGPSRGRYQDFGGGGLSLSLFDAAAQFGPFSDWKEARNAYAKQVDVKLPAGDESDRAMDRLDIYDLTPVAKMMWANAKQGVLPRALDQVGASGARWPVNATPHNQQGLLSVPMFGHGLLDLDPIAYHSAPLAGRHIEKYQGEGNAPAHIRTMTLGTGGGIMNAWACQHLAEAEVVWIVEGLSDLLAMQSVLSERTDHVVVSFGGCTMPVDVGLLPAFVGKDVRICYDNDEYGIPGAQVMVGKLVDVAAEVRNVLLPAGTNDLRDYLNDQNDYAALWAYSETFEEITPADTSEQLSTQQALLERLGIVICGQIDGTESVEIYSRDRHKTTVIKDINRFSYVSATLAIGDIVDEVITKAKEPEPGKSTVQDMQVAIANEGGKKPLSSRPAAGCGIWPVGKSIVLVGPRHADIYTPSGDLEPVDSPVVGTQRLHFNGESWYDRPQLRRYLQDSDDDKWIEQTFGKARDLFARWDNWESETAPELIAALVAASWVQTLWPFRPLIGILGGTNCGKSMLLVETLPHIFGGLTIAVEKPTEAGLRQSIGDTAKVVILDEFEKCEHRAKILELLRTSCRGGKIARGSAGGGAARMYGLKHIVWTGAIEINLSRQADANRFLLFNLNTIPKGTPPTIFKPGEKEKVELGILGQKLLAFVLRRFPRITRRAEAIKRLTIDVDNRALELYSVPISIIAEAGCMSEEETADYATMVIGYQQKDVVAESDEADLITTILESQVRLPKGIMTTVSALLTGSAGIIEDVRGDLVSTADVLATVGLRVLREGKLGEDVSLFVGVKPARDHLLNRTKYRDSDIAILLSRVDNASRRRKLVGGHKPNGVAVPFASLSKLVGFDDGQSGEF